MHPERSALDEFGYELRKRRKAQRLSLARLGALVHVSGDLLHKIETAQRWPSQGLARDCDRVLEAGGALVNAWPAKTERNRQSRAQPRDIDKTAVHNDNQPPNAPGRPTSGTMVLPVVSLAAETASVELAPAIGEGWPPSDAYASDRDIVPCRTEDGRIIWVSIPRRRVLLGGIGAAASAIAIPSAALRHSAARLIASISSADGNPFERFETMRKVLMDADNLFGPAQVMRLAHEQITMLDGLRQSLHGTDYLRLLKVETQFADLLSWLYQDSGDHANAQYWLGRSLDWSHIFGDAGTIAFILARKSQLAGQFQDGAEAVEVADAAMKQVAPNNRSAVIATAYAAHGHALRGDKASCLRAYDRANGLLADVEAEEPTWYGRFLNQAYIEVQRAHSLSALQEYGAAAESFDVALSALPGNYYRDRGVYLARKALAHAGVANTGKDDADDHASVAASSGLEALTIGIETHSGRIYSDLTQVSKNLANWRRLPAVEEFTQAMHEIRPVPVGLSGKGE